MPSSSGGVRVKMHIGRCQICGGDDKILTAKCKRCRKRACEKLDCQKSILDVDSCRVPEKCLPA
jgi:hypothetical protein